MSRFLKITLAAGKELVMEKQGEFVDQVNDWKTGIMMKLDELHDDFEDDLCDWTQETDDPANAFKWQRKSAKQLANQNIPGPNLDVDEGKKAKTTMM